MAAMSMATLCSSNANYVEANEAGVLNHAVGRKSQNAAGGERAHIIDSASAPSTSSSSSGGRCWPSSQRWCKESLTAMETHLSLLQQTSQTPALNAKLSRAAPPLDLASHMGAALAQLPYGWEQHLDLRTGRIYYFNWETCKRSYNDPRKALRRAEEIVNGLMQQAMNNALKLAEGKDYINHEEKLQSSVTQELNGVCGYSKNLNILMQPCNDISKNDEEMEVESKWKPNEELADRFSDNELRQGSQSDDMTNGSINFLSSLIRTNSDDHSHNDGSNAPNKLDASTPKLEALSCHHCLSHIIIHIANPWCPLCGFALV
ncbi:hypothetical protein GOP47_0025733 [Adiantum capillus-veneris]|uniref:WW domain-containing protein n=1 Tax=Adiantum capillus-veneris TaxID=13818 RepID=A0A9D4U2M2_ADICA|nr:hypothetical protein GOP47_0025733 [Adiantum capillus-veneris]